MKKLPYRAITETGDVFEFEFPLHEETGSPMRVDQILSTVLAAVDRDLSLAGDTSNGDVLQALAMALATRARMIHAEPASASFLARRLVDTALEAASEAERHVPQSGNA